MSETGMADDRSQPARFRLAWRWKESGWTGAGPWVRDSGAVESMLDSLSRRHGDRILHWIESENDESPPGGGPDARTA
jgi:hypothetical protein